MFTDISTFLFVSSCLAVLVGVPAYMAKTVYAHGWEEGKYEIAMQFERMANKVWYIEDTYYGEE